MSVSLYKEWRATWFKPPHFPQWVKNVNAWQQYANQFAGAGIPCPLYEPGFIRRMRTNGVSAIQLVG